jgi:hypothetical protein
VTVLTDGASVIRSTASSDVARLEVSTGRHRVEGALIKGAIGLGLGVVSGRCLEPRPLPSAVPPAFSTALVDRPQRSEDPWAARPGSSSALSSVLRRATSRGRRSVSVSSAAAT